VRRRGSAGEKALGDTEAKLDEIRSGRLSLRLLASSVDAPEGQGTGFQVEGPFAVGKAKGSLPVADLRYTRVTGSQRRTTRFLSTGSAAFVEVDGRTTRLTDQQVAGLRVDEEGPTVEVVTGKEDRLLRRADVSVTLAVVDPRVRDALGDLAGARLRMALDVAEINRPVQVADPKSG